MDKKWKKRWVKALKSGEYKQTRERLRSDQGAVCCLGVLCEISKAGKWVPIPKDSREKKALPFEVAYDYRGAVNGAVIPEPLADKLNIRSDSLDTLVRLNDHAHYSFKKIAKWIERNL